jgi:hypothetical protein
MAHLLGIAGLLLSTVGAVLLLWFPPVVTSYTQMAGSSLRE